MPAIDTERNTRVRPPRAKRKPVYGPPAPKRPTAPVGKPQLDTRPKAKPVYGPPAPPPKPAVRKPTPAEVTAGRSRQRVRETQARNERKQEPARRRAEARAREQGPFTKHPVAGMLGAERNAIAALSDLRASDPEKYDKALERDKLKKPDTFLREYEAEKARRREGDRAFTRKVQRTLGQGPISKEARREGRETALTGVVEKASLGIPGAALAQRLPIIGKLHRNAVKDVAEQISSTPTSTAHLVHTTLKGKPGEVVEELAKPYVEAAKHPVKSFTERPVSTAQLALPVAKLPGRVVGRGLRLAGKQTLAREPATLPGTALKQGRRKSRDAIANKVQSIRDRKHGAPTMSHAEVQKRVDEHYDYRSHKMSQAADHAAQEAKDQQMTHAQAQAHIEQAKEHARLAADEQFAREFGANVRPSTGAAEKRAAKQERKQAEKNKKQAKANERAAHAEVESALSDARASRGTPSDQLAVLEAQRVAALKELASSKTGHGRAQVAHERAKGAAAVSQAKPKTSPQLRELHAERKATASRGVTPAVVEARRVVSQADRAVAAAEKRGLKTPEVEILSKRVAWADRQVEAIAKQLQAAEERASQLKGRTEGRHAAGRMTSGAGKAAADQAERIGALKDELTRVQRVADDAHEQLTGAHAAAHARARTVQAAAREALKHHEGVARTALADALREINDRIRIENRRIAGVGPKQADRLHGAIAGLDEAATRVHTGRQAVKDLDARIAAERRRTAGVHPEAADRLLRALETRDTARTSLSAARAAENAAKTRHVETKHAAANAQLVAPKGEGRIFTDKADAHKVADRLNEAAHTIPRGGKAPVRYVDAGGGMQRLARTPNIDQPHEFVVRPVGDRWAVLPKVAAQRMEGGEGQLGHLRVGTSKSTVAKLMRTSRGAFTQATLPLSMKWLMGQAVEAGGRSLIAGAGPMDLLRMKRIVKRMNAEHPGSGDELMTRLSGGQFGLTGAARQFAEGKSLAEEFRGTGLEQPMRGVTHAGQAAPVKAIRKGWSNYTKAVLGSINGFIESNARLAMGGQALKNSAFNERRINALSEKAIDDAAKGLKGTEAQVQLARDIDRMYGQYQKFSPEMRSVLLHWTPFLPWYLNTAKFLFHHLPADHPMTNSLLVSANLATEEWRKDKGLSLYADEHAPNWLMGSYPIFGDNLSRISQFTPWGVGTDVGESAASLVMPQFVAPLMGNLRWGVDYKGDPLVHGDTGEKFSGGERAVKAGVSALEAQIPGLSQAMRISGLQAKVDKKAPDSIPSLKERALKELPLYPAGGAESGGSSGGVKVKPVTVKPVKVKPVKIKPIKVGG